MGGAAAPPDPQRGQPDESARRLGFGGPIAAPPVEGDTLGDVALDIAECVIV